MSSLPKTMGINCPKGSWPKKKISGWEWPVLEAYKIVYNDGSIGYYPSWHSIPNEILHMQSEDEGYYEGAEVTAITWDQVQD